MVSASMGGTGAGAPMGAAGTCTNCGSSFTTDQAYCGRCGRSLAGQQPAIGTLAADNPQGTFRQGAEDSMADGPPYESAMVLGAVLLSIFVPFIALIAALIMRGQERIQARRQFLKNWAIGSAAWLATGWLIGLIALVAIGGAATGAASCKGGIDQTVPPTYTSTDGTHWTGTFTCMNGGTITKSVPASSVPGGGS